MSDTLTGTGRLVRLALRRDRVVLPVWVLSLALLLAAVGPSVLDFYPTEEDRLELAVSSARSPVSLLFNGLVSGTSPGATVMTQSLLIMLLAVAFMSSLTVVRHTRADEETGRAELVGAAVVGRYAMLSAALVVAVLADLLVAVLSAAVLVANDLPVSGSLAAGAAIGLCGATFAAVAAVAVQVPDHARTANGLAAAAIGVAFLLRALGDAASTVVDGGTRTESSWLSWLSPIGWAQQVRPYDDDAWWVCVLFLVAVVTFTGTAYALTSHRDVGAGLLAARPGPARAPRALLSPLGLAWRLHRGVLLGWTVGVVVLGAAYGGVGDEIDEFIDDGSTADVLEDLGGAGASLTDTYFAAILSLMGIIVAGYTVQALLRTRSEETSGRLEWVLATSVSRTRWLGSHLLVAGLGTAWLLLLTGLSAGITYGLTVGDVGTHAFALVPGALVQLPAALVLAGAAVVVFGFVPSRAVALSWAAFVLCLLLGQLGALLQLPSAVLDLSPFTHVPRLPVDAFAIPPLAALIAVATALAVAGFAGFRRRDVVP